MRRIPLSIIELVVVVAMLGLTLGNGTSPNLLESQLRLASGLFTAHNLGAPVVSSVTFDPDDPFCEAYAGRYDATDSSVLICLDVDTLIRGDSAPLHPRDRGLLIHELAHAWMQTHTTAEQRAAFVELMGCDSWNDADERWHRRGTEVAAQTFVWALTDGEIWPRSIASRDVDDLQAGFEILTDR
jgi:hypothetical protein